MGGRVALHLALAAPDRISRLVLASASPGLADPQERVARIQSDESLAAVIERNGISAFVDRWEALPLFASQARLPVETRARLRTQRLRNSLSGLANSLRGMGAGVHEPLHEQLRILAMPVLLMAGALDNKYCDLAHLMATRLPNARVVIVPEAGHAVHLEQPQTFEHTVLDFLYD